MGRVVDTYTQSIDEMPAWIAARVEARLDGCEGCAEERRARLRKAHDAFAGLASCKHITDPKGSTADFEALYERVRWYVAHLTRILRSRPPARCAKHADPHPGWCGHCWPHELRRRQELLEDDSLSGEALELALEKRADRVCRHYRRPFPELQADSLDRPGPRRYRLDCPLCEREANLAIAALRAEVADGRSSVEDALEMVALELQRECEHLHSLAPAPARRADGRQPRLPWAVPDVDHARALLSSTDELAVADAVAALGLHMEQLDCEAFGGSPYSAVGMDFNPDADAHGMARSSFGSDPAVYLDDITEAEIHVTRHMEMSAREAASRIFGDSFKGFNHLEGGVADVVMDADVAAARFRFAELIEPFVATTEERFDAPTFSHKLDREVHYQRPEGAVVAERLALKALLPRLVARLELLRVWDIEDLALNEGLSSMDEARDLAARWAQCLSPLELATCDPREDGPSLWECLHFPDRVLWRIRQHDDAPPERGGLVPQGKTRRPGRTMPWHVRPAADHAWAWDGEPTGYDTGTTEWIPDEGVAA